MLKGGKVCDDSASLLREIESGVNGNEFCKYSGFINKQSTNEWTKLL